MNVYLVFRLPDRIGRKFDDIPAGFCLISGDYCGTYATLEAAIRGIASNEGIDLRNDINIRFAQGKTWVAETPKSLFVIAGDEVSG